MRRRADPSLLRLLLVPRHAGAVLQAVSGLAALLVLQALRPRTGRR